MRLGYRPRGGDTVLEVGGGGSEKEEEEKKKMKEKIPLCESIGHQPLQGRCPAPTLNYDHDLPKQGKGTADHLTLLRLFPLRRLKTSWKTI